LKVSKSLNSRYSWISYSLISSWVLWKHMPVLRI
jgi:hypothetical protein